MLSEYSKFDKNKLFYGKLIIVKMLDDEQLIFEEYSDGIFYKYGFNCYYNLCDNELYRTDMSFCVNVGESLVKKSSLVKIDNSLIDEMDESCKLVLRNRIK